jgi:hypothetical protein
MPAEDRPVPVAPHLNGAGYARSRKTSPMKSGVWLSAASLGVISFLKALTYSESGRFVPVKAHHYPAFRAIHRCKMAAALLRS